jgi:hypothetical protein
VTSAHAEVRYHGVLLQERGARERVPDWRRAQVVADEHRRYRCQHPLACAASAPREGLHRSGVRHAAPSCLLVGADHADRPSKIVDQEGHGSLSAAAGDARKTGRRSEGEEGQGGSCRNCRRGEVHHGIHRYVCCMDARSAGRNQVRRSLHYR